MRLLLPALLALSSLVLIAAPASAAAHSAPVDCINCDPFNQVCQKLWHVNCLGIDGPSLQCANEVCNAIERICGRWGAHCVA